MFFEGGVGLASLALLPVVINVLWRLVGSRHLYVDLSHFRPRVGFISPHRPCAASNFVYRVVHTYITYIHTSV
jgi:hypothetical protein